MEVRAAALTRRLAVVDVLRGLIMVVMVLDHTRDFFSSAGVDPTDPNASWPALFFTRWITHLCAPGFVALAGTSVYLQKLRGRSSAAMAERLVTRGLWLIFVELAIVSFGIFFTYHFHFMQVIYAIGGSMIVLAALQFLPVPWVLAYGILVVAGHHLLEPVKLSQLGSWAWLWKLTMFPGGFTHDGQFWALNTYPVIPWSGVMALGYAFGQVAAMDSAPRRRWAVGLGAGLLALFGVLRATNAYGDPILFRHLGSATRTTMSFLQLTKYPPSLQYVCATFGVLLLLFAFFDYALAQGWWKSALGVLDVYGRVPFFYYVPHFFILHLAALFTLMVMSHTVHVQAPTVLDPPKPGYGFGLPVVYAIWLAVVAALYLPCRWFAGVKARRKDWWLSYL